MKIKLTKVNREDGTRYCFVDPKGREWRISEDDGEWILRPPEGYTATWRTYGFDLLKSLRERLGKLLEEEAANEKAADPRDFRYARSLVNRQQRR